MSVYITIAVQFVCVFLKDAKYKLFLHITAFGAGEHQQLGGGLQHYWPICIKLQNHKIWLCKSTHCAQAQADVDICYAVVLQYNNYTPCTSIYDLLVLKTSGRYVR